MPKEQPQCGESTAQSNSKNAKEKSNCATLRTCQAASHRELSAAHYMSKHVLCWDSEKDSGYSEAGSDDQHSSKSQPFKASSKSSNNITTAYEELPPIYVLKHLLVKPPGPEQLLHGPLSWAGDWQSLSSGKAPTQLVLIQQPVMPAPSSSTVTSSSCQASRQAHVKKAGSRSSHLHSSKNSYLPILNSYPRIAPHPRKDICEGKEALRVQGGKESEGQSQRKRVRTEEEKREVVSTIGSLPRPEHLQQLEGREGHSSSPSTQHQAQRCLQNSLSVSLDSPSSSQTPSPPSSSTSSSSCSPPSSSPSSSTVHGPHRAVPDSTSTRQRRFLNTAEILNQSGLLAITLRTKELLRQNSSTEREILQLRQHTHLLCNIAQASQSSFSHDPHSLNRLFQDMNGSGSYPDLDLHHLKTLGSSHQHGRVRDEDGTEGENHIKATKIDSSSPPVVSLHSRDDGNSPPSPLFAPSPDTEETFTSCALEPVSTSL
ncbi:CLOCK-interacting pacemaker-like [Leuresthes tenuis]|uniref:CLOCK-interacting pacemaker-like n=1 Tax=Leuresthes tenuis TaxID=355514 RepID=UPI003B50952E